MPTETTKRRRTCIACGTSREKTGLVRLVRTAEGEVALDPTGRVPGRGAYVCSGACLAASRKTRKLERALRCKVTEEAHERLAREIALMEAPGRNEE